MDFNELIERANELAEELINDEDVSCVRADAIGLDIRAAHSLYVSPSWIAVKKDEDRTLQYYGGFEYVDKEFRTEVGTYVFYSSEDERVQGHIDRLEEVQGYNDDDNG